MHPETVVILAGTNNLSHSLDMRKAEAQLHNLLVAAKEEFNEAKVGSCFISFSLISFILKIRKTSFKAYKSPEFPFTAEEALGPAKDSLYYMAGGEGNCCKKICSPRMKNTAAGHFFLKTYICPVFMNDICCIRGGSRLNFG